MKAHEKLRSDSLRFELDPPLDRSLTDQLLDLWVDVANAGGAVGFAAPVSRDEVRAVADSAFEGVRTGGDHLVAALLDDRPVGFAFLVHRPGPLFRHWATLKRLQVHPALQRSGIGGSLLDEIHRYGRTLGLEQLHLTVRGGTGTERFYEQHGYQVVARIPDVIRLSPEDTREEIYMVVRFD